MKRTRHTDAMRALSDLYRIEAERIETAQDVGSLSALRTQLKAVQSDRAALESEIRGRSFRRSQKSGIPRETAWKILTATFAFAGLAGFLTALWSEPAPVPFSATLTPLALPLPADSRPTAPDTSGARVLQNEAVADSVNTLSTEGPAAPTPHAAVQSKPGNDFKRGRGKPGGRAGGSAKPRPKPRPKPSDDGLGFFDDCGLDPMCGFDKKRP